MELFTRQGLLHIKAANLSLVLKNQRVLDPQLKKKPFILLHVWY